MDQPVYEDVFEEVFYDLAWGFVWSSFLTYPVTMYLFPEIWAKLNFYTALAVLVCAWVVVTLIVQIGRDSLERKSKP